MTKDVDREMQLLRRYLRQRHVSKQLQIRILKCVEKEFIEHGDGKRLRDKDVHCLEFLSKSLVLELRYEEYSPLLTCHPLLSAWNRTDEQSVRLLCMLAKPLSLAN